MEPTERNKAQPFVTRSEQGYQNVQAFPDPPSFPESQSFSTTTATSLATGTGTSAWTTVDVSQLVPYNTEFVHVYFYARKQTIGSFDGGIDVRRDDQVDSVVYRKLQIYFPSSDFGNASGEFFVPVTMGMQRFFDFRVTGTGSSLSLTSWGLELRGYTTRRRNVADANTTIRNGGTSTDSASGGIGGGSTPGAEL